MFKWLKNRKKKKRDTELREIAEAVRRELSASQSWEKYLPPVTMDGKIYIFTESGKCYRMQHNRFDEMEQIVQIRT